MGLLTANVICLVSIQLVLLAFVFSWHADRAQISEFRKIPVEILGFLKGLFVRSSLSGLQLSPSEVSETFFSFSSAFFVFTLILFSFHVLYALIPHTFPTQPYRR